MNGPNLRNDWNEKQWKDRTDRAIELIDVFPLDVEAYRMRYDVDLFLFLEKSPTDTWKIDNDWVRELNTFSS